jgi:hypothetical protein
MKDALTFAAQAIGVRGDVVVKVTSCRHGKGSATAYRSFPYLGFLRGVKRREGMDGKLIGEKPGFVVMSLPDRMRGGETYGRKHSWTYDKLDWLDACWWFVRVALHEMAHVLQYRENRYAALRSGEKTQAGRRMAHDRRPCELDADNRRNDVVDDRRKGARAQEFAINLAIAIEENLR